MAYIDPRLAAFQRAPIASGPGIHADEVDSALAEIASRLSAGTRRTLAEEAAPDLDGATVIPNPLVGGDEDEEDVPDQEGSDNPWGDDSVVRLTDIMPLTKLITGQWGPEGAGTFRQMDIRPNPPRAEVAPDARDYAPFFDRMDECLRGLTSLRERTARRYAEVRGAQIARAETALADRPTPAERTALRRRIAAAQSTKNLHWLDALDRCIRGVRYVIAEKGKARQSILPKPVSDGGLPLGERWSVIAAKGNKKLPFAAYSEAPMATCPGAGVCRVPMDVELRRKMKSRGLAWCYSFRAYRYPAAFSRLFLNTLCNYADREFAILRGDGPTAPPARATRTQLDAFERERSAAALRGRGSDGEDRFGRVWMQYVKGLVLAKTAHVRRGTSKKHPRLAFFRLFVDGDVNFADCLVEWMEVCRQMADDGADISRERRGGREQTRHVEVYGYSKCWAAFGDADRFYRHGGVKWPANYTLNLSSGSVYHGGADDSQPGKVRKLVEGLPITRGYFEAIPLDRFLVKLEEETQRQKKHLPLAGDLPFAFSPDRVRDFVDLNRVRSLRDLSALWKRWKIQDPSPLTVMVSTDQDREAVEADRDLPFLPKVRVERYLDRALLRRSVEQQVRAHAYGEYLSRLLRDDHAFGALVRREIARDMNYDSEREYLAAMRKKSRKRADDALTSGGKEGAAFAKRALHEKALALALHEVLVAFGLGGSCPLVCGNCSDTPELRPESRHRCASKGPFHGQVISIGQH